MKIGILVSGSALFPTCGMQFCNGAELAFKLNNANEVILIKEDAGSGANADVVTNKANKLLTVDGADIVIAYVSHALYPALANLFTEHKKLLVLAEMGGCTAFDRKTSPYIFYHSLNEWASARLAGRYLAQQGHKEVLNAISLMEAGYHIGPSFLNGFGEAGGKIGAFHVSNLNPDSSYFEQLRAEINNGGHDLLYCGFTGADAVQFLEQIGPVLADSGIALAGPSLFAIPPVVRKYGSQMQKAITGSAYYPELDNELNRAFIEDFKNISDHEVDRFALLGYECGLILSKCAVYNDFGKFMTADCIRQMEQEIFETPRGKVWYHPEMHYSLSGTYIAALEQAGDTYINSIIATVEAEDMEDWRADVNSQPVGGWLNPYPCT